MRKYINLKQREHSPVPPVCSLMYKRKTESARREEKERERKDRTPNSGRFTVEFEDINNEEIVEGA